MTESRVETGIPASAVPFITRVCLKNYKSIASCDVRLGPLTMLVGPNGSGKSNFLDALAFLSRALATTPSEAIESRGGLMEILRRVPEPTDSFSIELEVIVPWGPLDHQLVNAAYKFSIGLPARRGLRAFEVIGEQCTLHWNSRVWKFRVERGQAQVEEPDEQLKSVSIEPDSLYLPVAGVTTTYGSLLARLRRMPFYNFDVEGMRQPQRPAPRTALGRTGEHLPDVLIALVDDSREYKQRIDMYLRAIVPGMDSLKPYTAGDYLIVTMSARTGANGDVVEFGPTSMSDGTIRAAGVLAAIFQPGALAGVVPFVGIEEPETSLHPAAAGVLFDALTEASNHVQILATTQSADLLDRDDLDVSIIRPVTMNDGLTIIGEVDDASREIAEKKLYTLGELMRGNQLAPKFSRQP
jgi:predicted ATPase